MFISGYMDKENVAYPYNGMLFSLKMEWNLTTWVNLKAIMLNEISQSRKDKQTLSDFIHMRFLE